jgi:hypothetical protein
MATAAAKLEWIKAHLASSHTIQITTYLRATRYTAKHADMFRLDGNALVVQRGRHWDCIDYCKISAFA